jgi:hypothetical protein
VAPKDKTLTGLAGEYYVLAQLAHRGFIGALTLSTTKAVDILVTEPELKSVCKLEVKTTIKPPRHARLFGDDLFFIWAMGEKHEQRVDDRLFYCFVAMSDPTVLPRFFIVPSAEVARYVRRQHQQWLGTRKRPVEPTTMRSFRIEVSDPKGYENNWDCLFRGKAAG